MTVLYDTVTSVQALVTGTRTSLICSANSDTHLYNNFIVSHVYGKNAQYDVELSYMKYSQFLIHMYNVHASYSRAMNLV